MTPTPLNSAVPKRLRRWRDNEALDHRKLNEPVDALERQASGVNPPGQIPVEAPSPIELKWFRVQAEAADYVVGREVDRDEVLDVDVLLAKPASLRVSEYETEVDGTITWAETDENERQATDSDDASTEDQVIVPQYLLPSGDFKGKLVLAVKGISNGTGVFVPCGMGNEEGKAPSSKELVWQIIDAAAFAKKSDA